MSVEFFLLGLDQIGTSIGLALAEADLELTRTGYDPDRRWRRRAEELGAVDRLVSHPRDAPKSADMVVLDAPIQDSRDYLEMLSQRLKPDGVVIDTTPLRIPTMAWAQELFPEDRHYLGARPIVGPEALLRQPHDPETPRADLFQGGLLAIVIPLGAPEGIVRLASDIASLIGAQPFFVDALEHDAVFATIEELPWLFGAALMRMAAHSPAWREIRRMAGVNYAHSTALVTGRPPGPLGKTLALNREHVVAKLDALVEELRALRTLVAQGEEEELSAYLQDAVQAREAWLTARMKGDWAGEEIQTGEIPSGRDFLRSLFGLRPRDEQRSG